MHVELLLSPMLQQIKYSLNREHCTPDPYHTVSSSAASNMSHTHDTTMPIKACCRRRVEKQVKMCFWYSSNTDRCSPSDTKGGDTNAGALSSSLSSFARSCCFSSINRCRYVKRSLSRIPRYAPPS